MDALLIIS